MITEADRLSRVEKRLDHIVSLIHGIWMAGASISDEPERDAIRDFAAHAGETIDDIVSEVRMWKDAAAAEAPAKSARQTGGQS